MRNIVYYVATSLDGLISSADGNIDGFIPEGKGIDRYLRDLKEYDTVIMGRNTYEFGYKFGLKPGQAPYPHMQHYIFSESLELQDKMDNVHIKKIDINEIHKLRKEEGTDIYLCGGGQLAGWLLEEEQIQYLKEEDVEGLLIDLRNNGGGSLKTAIEIGKWPDGRILSDEQKASCMEAVLRYQALKLDPTQHSGYMTGRCKSASSDEQVIKIH